MTAAPAHFIVAGLAIAILAGSAAAQESILERRYTSDKLDGFWTTTLGAESPAAAWFEMLAPGSTAAAPVNDAPAGGGLDVPFPGVIIGELAGPQGGGGRKAFPVIPLPADEAAVLIRRLAWAEIYLNRYRSFERVSTDTTETLAALAARQYAAGIEAYLILARLYYAAPELTEKCARLTRLRAVEAGPLAGITEEALPPGWRPLAPIQTAASERLDAAVLAALVCTVTPVRTRGEMERIVTTRVRERIMGEVRTKVDETLVLLRAASGEFQALVNDMDVPILSAEILELERVLGNARANMLMVKEDQLSAADTIATLQAVDLSALDEPAELEEYEAADRRMQEMVSLIDGVLGAVAELDQINGDEDVAIELAPCGALRGAYLALDLGRDSSALTREVNDPYEDCLARARAVVTRFQQPTLQKALMAELATRVRQLSEAFLSSGDP